ncbi:MAG: hypothetical protein ABI554_02300 [Flavobacterium sp.]
MNTMGGYSGMKGSPRTGNNIPKGYESGSIQQFTPEQMDLFKQLFSNVGSDSYLSKLAGGDQSYFDEIEAPALKQFSGLQGNIASRFSGMGLGGRKNSGFQNTLNSASSDFASGLQSKRQEMRQNAIRELMGLSGDLLGQRPQENFLAPKQKPWWQEMLTGIGQTAVKSGVESAFKGSSGFGG